MHISSLFLLVAVALTIGCNQGPRRDFGKLQLASVSGKIQLDGVPLENAKVFFVDQTTKTYSFGKTDAGGRYSMQFDTTKSGVLPGKKSVTIWLAKTGPEFGEEVATENENGVVQTKVEPIPEKYNVKTELTTEVVPKKSQTFEFDLKTK